MLEKDCGAANIYLARRSISTIRPSYAKSNEILNAFLNVVQGAYLDFLSGEGAFGKLERSIKRELSTITPKFRETKASLSDTGINKIMLEKVLPKNSNPRNQFARDVKFMCDTMRSDEAEVPASVQESINVFARLMCLTAFLDVRYSSSEHGW